MATPEPVKLEDGSGAGGALTLAHASVTGGEATAALLAADTVPSVATVATVGGDGVRHDDGGAATSSQTAEAVVAVSGGCKRFCIAEGCSHPSKEGTDFCAMAGATAVAAQHLGDALRQHCTHPGCARMVIHNSIACKAHGGGKRCQHHGCTKSAQGNTAYCKGHGGGKRCQMVGCTKSARDKTLHCKAHGGGKRCAYGGGCTKSAEGVTNFCVAHGGGRRCQQPECPKSAIGTTKFCIKHGGGKRCHHDECTKSAQGCTNFCKAHGGGKRCSEQGCDKSSRGNTSYCVAHTRARQCRHEKCALLAQGVSLPFCKNHTPPYPPSPALALQLPGQTSHPHHQPGHLHPPHPHSVAGGTRMMPMMVPVMVPVGAQAPMYWAPMWPHMPQMSTSPNPATSRPPGSVTSMAAAAATPPSLGAPFSSSGMPGAPASATPSASGLASVAAGGSAGAAGSAANAANAGAPVSSSGNGASSSQPHYKIPLPKVLPARPTRGSNMCIVKGCLKYAVVGTVGDTSRCIGHGGGKRCQGDNCTKSAVGTTDYCIAHGGGKRCSEVGCTKAARGSTSFCITHGGGKRCQVPGCNKVVEGSSSHCTAHNES